MIVYWSACVLSIMFAWFGLHVKHRKFDTSYYLKLSFFAALPLIFISSIRYDVGMDYLATYVPYFKNVQQGIGDSRMELLYALLNKIIVILGGEYPWVFAISAIVFFVSVYYHFFTDSPYPYLSIFLLLGTTYLFIFFNGMRQLIGCSILLFSLKYARDHKLFKFSLVVVIATLFHWSCAAFAVVYFVSNMKLKPLAIAILTFVFILVSPIVIKIITTIVQQTRYAQYIGSKFDDGNQGIITMLMNLVVLLFAMVFTSNDPKFIQYRNLQVIATWISILCGEVVLISRIRWMFGVPCCILIPMALKNVRGADKRMLFGLAVVVLYFIYTSYTIGIQNGNSVLPYQTIFSVM